MFFKMNTGLAGPQGQAHVIQLMRSFCLTEELQLLNKWDFLLIQYAKFLKSPVIGLLHFNVNLQTAARIA